MQVTTASHVMSRRQQLSSPSLFLHSFHTLFHNVPWTLGWRISHLCWPLTVTLYFSSESGLFHLMISSCIHFPNFIFLYSYMKSNCVCVHFLYDSISYLLIVQQYSGHTSISVVYWLTKSFWSNWVIYHILFSEFWRTSMLMSTMATFLPTVCECSFFLHILTSTAAICFLNDCSSGWWNGISKEL